MASIDPDDYEAIQADRRVRAIATTLAHLEPLRDRIRRLRKLLDDGCFMPAARDLATLLLRLDEKDLHRELRLFFPYPQDRWPL